MAVYFLRSETGERLIKIGFSNNVESRIKALQTASPAPLKLICVIPGKLEDESRIKKRFASLRIRGEWFVPDDVLLDFINTERAKQPSFYRKPRRGRAKSGRAKVSHKKQAAIFSPQDFKLALKLTQIDRHHLRNKVLLWYSFGCGLRVTEIAQLKIKDVIRQNGEVIDEGWLPSSYSKNKKGRRFYVIEDDHLQSVEDYLDYRVINRMRVHESEEYRGLHPESPFLLVTKNRGFSFRRKTYIRDNGDEVDYWVCSSMQQLLTDLLKRTGVKGASSHSGRRTLATRLADRGVDVELIKHILGHSEVDQTVDYIEHNEARTRDILVNVYRNV